MALDPREDGISHINVWSRGQTTLGRKLTNFAHTPFTHPHFGPFESMEGFWYWLATGCQHDHLRQLWGYLAKQEGKKLEKVSCVDFEDFICEGIYHKVLQTDSLVLPIAHSDLPFYHYYWYGDLVNGKYKVVVPESGYFQMAYLEDLRFHLRHLINP